MKSVTLIAIIATILQAIASLYYMLASYEVIRHSNDVSKIMNVLLLLSSIGFIIFFINLYTRQSKS
jgi:hypothetical protein